VINAVTVSASARKGLRHVPEQIASKLRTWIDAVEHVGLEEVRKRPGYHDEPLHGDRRGQRSIRLNRSWRAIYVVLSDGRIEFVEVREVNKHEY
jgi:toxin HigB-1